MLAAGTDGNPDASSENGGIFDLGPAGADSEIPAGRGAATSRPQQLVQFSELEIENYVAPRYPSRASETGISGTVDLQFDVNEDGSTSNIEIVNAVPPDTFVPSAINAVRQWRFVERDDVVRARVRLRFDPQAPQ